MSWSDPSRVLKNRPAANSQLPIPNSQFKTHWRFGGWKLGVDGFMLHFSHSSARSVLACVLLSLLAWPPAVAQPDTAQATAAYLSLLQRYESGDYEGAEGVLHVM